MIWITPARSDQVFGAISYPRIQAKGDGPDQIVHVSMFAYIIGHVFWELTHI